MLSSSHVGSDTGQQIPVRRKYGTSEITATSTSTGTGHCVSSGNRPDGSSLEHSDVSKNRILRRKWRHYLDSRSNSKHGVCARLDAQGRAIAVIRAVSKVGGRAPDDRATFYTSQSFTSDDVPEFSRPCGSLISVSHHGVCTKRMEKRRNCVSKGIRCSSQGGIWSGGIAADAQVRPGDGHCFLTLKKGKSKII
jgi:hypothetical protein